MQITAHSMHDITGSAREGLNFRGLICGLLLVGLTATGCATTSQDADRLKASTTFADNDYRIGVDDRLQITVWRNPDLSALVPVRPDGKISAPLIGDVLVGGKTPDQVSALIRQKLTAFIREPNVTVMVTELRSHEYISRVRVTGAVRTPRSMPYRPGMTVLDAVLEAGGPNEYSAPNRAKLYRKEKNSTEVVSVELGDILSRGKLQTNIELKPGDVVTVPERLF